MSTSPRDPFPRRQLSGGALARAPHCAAFCAPRSVGAVVSAPRMPARAPRPASVGTQLSRDLTWRPFGPRRPSPPPRPVPRRTGRPGHHTPSVFLRPPRLRRRCAGGHRARPRRRARVPGRRHRRGLLRQPAIANRRGPTRCGARHAAHSAAGELDHGSTRPHRRVPAACCRSSRDRATVRRTHRDID